jgi:hypothetical protein
MLDTCAPQPAPVPGKESITDQVIEDLVRRREGGVKKYQMELRTRNGRSMLVDAYQELLDASLYIRGALMEQVDSERAVSELETAVKTLLLLHRAGGPNLAWLRSAIGNVDRAIRLLTPPGRSGEQGRPPLPSTPGAS